MVTALAAAVAQAVMRANCQARRWSSQPFTDWRVLVRPEGATRGSFPRPQQACTEAQAA
jgi:hypothetical protein